jgi:hypothetical protein
MRKKCLRDRLTKKAYGGSSGANILLFGLMLFVCILFIGLIQTLRGIMSSRKDMIDADITLSLLSVDVADKELLGNSNIISLEGASALRNAGNTGLSSVEAGNVKLITDLVSSLSANMGDTTDNKNDLYIENDTLFGDTGYLVVKEITIVDKRPVSELHKYSITSGTKYGVYDLYGVTYSYNGATIDGKSAYDVDHLKPTATFTKEGNTVKAGGIGSMAGLSESQISNGVGYSWTPGATWYASVENTVGKKWKDVPSTSYGGLALTTLDGRKANQLSLTDFQTLGFGSSTTTAEQLFSIAKDAFYKYYKDDSYGEYTGNSLQYIEGIDVEGDTQKQTEIESGVKTNVNITDCTIILDCDIYFDMIGLRKISKQIYQTDSAKVAQDLQAIDSEENKGLYETHRIRMVQLKKNDGNDEQKKATTP